MSKKPSSSSSRYGVTNHNPVDGHVGKRIRQARVLAGLTQTQLADALQITFQQVQKYERGANRVSASRLWDMAQVMGVEIGFFFDQMPSSVQQSSPRLHQKTKLDDSLEDSLTLAKDPIIRRESLELLRSYYLIKSPHLRKKIVKMIKSAGDDTGSAERQESTRSSG